MSEMAEKKFTSVRKRLDQMGYRQPMGIESLPLVEKIFNDLIHTTECLKNSKLQLSRSSKDGSSFEEFVEPFRSDNSKLVRENNDLHQQLIKVKEELDSSSKHLKNSIRKLEHENADLRFLNSQYVHKVRALEKDAKSKADRIAQLQEKNLHAVVQTPGGKKRNIPFRRQRMEIEATVPPSSYQAPPTPEVNDPYIADLLVVADKQLESLRVSSAELGEQHEADVRTIKALQKQVDARDEEIQRLNRQLKGGRPEDVVNTESRGRSNERLISHLNVQIEYLQQANKDLEKQLRETKQSRNEGRMKIEELARELHDVDRLAKQLEADKNVAIKTADKDVSHAEYSLHQSKKEQDDLRSEREQLKQENKHLRSDLSSLETDFSVKQQEVDRLQDILDTAQGDKERLSERINKLASNERELVLELERVRKKSKQAAGSTPSKIDNYLQTLEEERDYYKGEVEVLNRILKNKASMLSTSSVRENSPLRSPSGKNKRSASPSRAVGALDRKSAAHYETLIRVLEDERDFYKKEHDLMRNLKRSQMSSPNKTTDSPSRKKGVSEETEVIRLRHERDELRVMLDKLERHLAEIQSNVKVLSADKEKISLMYEQSNEELQRLRREIIQSPKNSRASIAAQSILQRVESERNEANADLRRLTLERDSLRERLKIATDSHLSDKARLQQQLEDLDHALQGAEQDRSTLQARMPNLQGMIATLEEQVRSQTLKIEEAREEASKNKANATHMRLIAEQAETSAEDHHRRLTQKSGELLATDDRLSRIEQRLADANAQNSLLRQEIEALRSKVAAVDRERDNLQMVVDEKTEKILLQERQLSERGVMIDDHRSTLADLEARLERTTDELGSREREIRSLRRQLDTTREELTETSRANDATLRENKRQQDDLATMTRENQSVNQELEEAVLERENLKTQVQAYITEIARIEDLLSAKDQEYRTLLENYRSASTDAQRWESEASERNKIVSDRQLEIAARDLEIQQMRERLNQMEREIEENISVQQSYEAQVSNLTRSLANMEENLRQVQEEKDALVQDLTAVRELCVKLDSTKESLSRQLTVKSIDHEQAEVTIEDFKQEVEMLRNQISTERTSVRNLENLLSNNREKDFQIQLDNQEQRSEIQLVKDRLSLADSKVQSQSREIQSLRSRAAQLESELERSKRQLTSEKFERERMSQELRRSLFSPSVTSTASKDFDSTKSSKHIRIQRSPSPQRKGIARSLSPELSLQLTPEKSILKTSPAYKRKSHEKR